MSTASTRNPDFARHFRVPVRCGVGRVEAEYQEAVAEPEPGELWSLMEKVFDLAGA
jgi:hypothetical protein